MSDSRVVAGTSSFEVLHDAGNGAWLTSLIPFVHQISATASYQSAFIGTCFVTTPQGHFVTARHVVEGAWKWWTATNYDSTVGNWAAPCALWMPGAYLIQIAALTILGDQSGGPDLAWGQLLLPSGPNLELTRMPALNFSDAPVEVGEQVTMVGYALADDRMDIDEAEGVFNGVGRLMAVTGEVTEVLDSVPQIPAPVFKLEQEMPGGMSGGPIFRTGTNEVVGVCARGLVTEDGGHYCYGSAVTPLLPYLARD